MSEPTVEDAFRAVRLIRSFTGEAAGVALLTLFTRDVNAQLLRDREREQADRDAALARAEAHLAEHSDYAVAYGMLADAIGAK